MRIWFNRGYSLAPIAAAMRSAEPDIAIYASVGEGMPQHAGPTDTWIEPQCPIETYVEWAQSMIVEHEIDVFVPFRHCVALSTADLDCRVVLPAGPVVLELLEDKYAFAQAMRGEPYHLPTQLISSSEALVRGLAMFRDLHGDRASPCVKPRYGVNGFGFWRLTRNRPLSHLHNPDGRNIQEDLYVAALREHERDQPIDDLVLMPYLPGPEVSFDILADQGRLLKYAARTKLPTGNQRIESEHPLGHVVAKLVKQFELSGVVNAQFRRDDEGDWHILEINARPAGGVVYTEKVGAEILADWLRLITGRITAKDAKHPTIDTEIAISTGVEIVQPVRVR